MINFVITYLACVAAVLSVCIPLHCFVCKKRREGSYSPYHEGNCNSKKENK